MTQQNIKYIQEALTYDPKSGELFWSKDRPEAHWKQRGYYLRYLREQAGKKVTSTINANGYKTLWLNNTMQYEHRIAFVLMTGQLPIGDVDHRNQNKLDNSWDNLRDVPHAINGRNIKKLSSNTSGYTGVTFFSRTGKWRAYVTVNGKQQHLGYFDSPDQAYQKRLDFIKTNHQLGYTPQHGH